LYIAEKTLESCIALAVKKIFRQTRRGPFRFWPVLRNYLKETHELEKRKPAEAGLPETESL
jgi:hypothetical protein